jgi:hypothetical protein
VGASRIGTSPGEASEALPATVSAAVPGTEGIASAEVAAASAKPKPQSAPPTPKPVTTPSPRPRGDCNPNYRFDAEGHKHFKLECFTKGGS